MFLDKGSVGEDLVPISVDFSGFKVFLGLFDFFFVQVLVEAQELSLFDGLGATDKLGDIVEDWCVKLEIFLFDLFNGFSHFIFNFSDFLVSFVDGNRLDFFWEWEFLDGFLNVLEGDLSLTEKIEHFNKKILLLYRIDQL